MLQTRRYKKDPSWPFKSWKLKNTPGGNHSRLDEAEEKISELEGIAIKTTQNETQEKKRNLKT